jgi:hypothetical protein
MENARNAENPMRTLFANFVLAANDMLPREKFELLESLNLAARFNIEPKDWRLVIKQVLHLSDTIEIAILDLWYTNQDIAAQRKIEYHHNQFALDFVDNYFKEDSQIDIWPDDSLNRAKERIKRFHGRVN